MHTHKSGNTIKKDIKRKPYKDASNQNARAMWRKRQEPLLQLGEDTQFALRQNRVPEDGNRAVSRGRVVYPLPKRTDTDSFEQFEGGYSRITFDEGFKPEDLLGDEDGASLENPSSHLLQAPTRQTGLPLGISGAEYNSTLTGTLNQKRYPPTLEPLASQHNSAPPASYLGNNGGLGGTSGGLGRVTDLHGTVNLNDTIGRADRAAMLLSNNGVSSSKNAFTNHAAEGMNSSKNVNNLNVPVVDYNSTQKSTKSEVQNLRDLIKNSSYQDGQKESHRSYYTNKSNAFSGNDNLGNNRSNFTTKDSLHNGENGPTSSNLQDALTKLYGGRKKVAAPGLEDRSNLAIPSFDAWSQLGASTTSSLRVDKLTVDGMLRRFGPNDVLCWKDDGLSCFSFMSVPSSYTLFPDGEDGDSGIASYMSHLQFPDSNKNIDKASADGFPAAPRALMTRDEKLRRKAEEERVKRDELMIEAGVGKTGSDVLSDAVAANARYLQKFVVEKPAEEKLKNKIRQWSDRCVVETVTKEDETELVEYTGFVQDPQELHELAMQNALREEEEVRTLKLMTRRRLDQQSKAKRVSVVRNMAERVESGSNRLNPNPKPNEDFVGSPFSNLSNGSPKVLFEDNNETSEGGRDSLNRPSVLTEQKLTNKVDSNSNPTLLSTGSKAMPHASLQSRFDPFGTSSQNDFNHNAIQNHSKVDPQSTSGAFLVSDRLAGSGSLHPHDTPRDDESFKPAKHDASYSVRKGSDFIRQNGYFDASASLSTIEKSLLNFLKFSVLRRCDFHNLLRLKESRTEELLDPEVFLRQCYNDRRYKAYSKDFMSLYEVNQQLVLYCEGKETSIPENICAFPITLKIRKTATSAATANEIVVDALDLFLRLPTTVLKTLFEEINRNEVQEGDFSGFASEINQSCQQAWKGALVERLSQSSKLSFNPKIDPFTLEKYAIDFSLLVQISRWRASILKEIADNFYVAEVKPKLLQQNSSVSPKFESNSFASPNKTEPVPRSTNAIPVVPGKRDLYECDMQSLYISASLGLEELEKSSVDRLAHIRQNYKEESLELLKLSLDVAQDGAADMFSPKNDLLSERRSKISFVHEEKEDPITVSPVAGKGRSANVMLSAAIRGWKIVVRLLDSEAEFAQVMSEIFEYEKLIARYNSHVEPYNKFQEVQKAIWGPLYKSALRISYLLCTSLASGGLEHLPENYIPLLHPVSQFVGCTGGHREMRIKLQEVLLEISERAKRVRLPVEAIAFEGRGDIILREAANAASVCPGGASDVVSCLATETDVVGLPFHYLTPPSTTVTSVKPLYEMGN